MGCLAAAPFVCLAAIVFSAVRSTAQADDTLAAVTGDSTTGAAGAPAAPPPRAAARVARRVDRLLAEEVLAAADESPAPLVDDVQFLRRVALDLVGVQPSEEELAALAADSSPKRRQRAVARLLDDPRYGENWARYWRDVFLYRRNDDRALLVSESVVRYLAAAFNENRPWDQIASEFLTARGEIGADGRTALFAAQWGEVPDIAAEASRIFIGVQIQCAQCHDHPTDRWQREQFHELAAFFPRIAVRRIIENGRRTGFEVIAVDPRGEGKNVPARARRRAEHFMPDLDDPAAEGTLMQPVFFVTGQQLEVGTPDGVRRETLAEWLTAAENPWFARALVNRLWAELVGEGFYEPIDDLGPDRECSAPRTLDLLADQFVAHEYDLKWLLATITATEAYQRASQPRRNPGEAVFVANCPQRLRSDQLFDSLLAAVGGGAELGSNNVPAAARGPRTPRALFAAVFGYDPSEPRDEVTGTIPQALFLMNAPQLAAAMRGEVPPRRDGPRGNPDNPRAQRGRALAGRPDSAQPDSAQPDGARPRGARPGGAAAAPPTTVLAELLAGSYDDRAVTTALYVRCLSREPTEGELTTVLAYLEEVGDRAEAFEDLFWALVNSTEFLYRN